MSKGGKERDRDREMERGGGKRRVRCPKGGKTTGKRATNKGGGILLLLDHGLQKLPLPRLCSAGIASLGLPSGDRDGRGRTLEARLGCEKSPPPKKKEREIEIEIERGGGRRVRCPKGRKRRENDKKIEVKDNDFIDCELKQTKGNERYKE